jgi:transposase
MDYHYHARLTICSREALAKDVLEGRLSLGEAAAERRLSRQSAGKWVRRYRESGVAGLLDRSSRPRRLRQPTSAEQIAQVEALRRERWTGVRIAQTTGLSRATVSRILVRLTLNKAKIYRRRYLCQPLPSPRHIRYLLWRHQFHDAVASECAPRQSAYRAYAQHGDT